MVVSLGLFCLCCLDIIGVAGICLGLSANAALCGWLLCIVLVWLAGLFGWCCVACVWLLCVWLFAVECLFVGCLVGCLILGLLLLFVLGLVGLVV